MKKKKNEIWGLGQTPPSLLKKSPEQVIAYIVRQMCGFFKTIAMVDEHCGVISELFECDFTELYILGSDHWTASTVKNENCRESPTSTPLIPKPNKNEHRFLCCFAWAHVVTLELWCLYWTALRASLNNTKCLLNFCHALLFHCIFACEYSILSSLLTIRRLIVPQQPWIRPLN